MSGSFAGRVAGVFATKVAIFAIGLVTTFMLARVLGPSGRGAYYLAILIPTTLLTLGQLGIPSALVFLAGRGSSLDGLRTTAVALAAVLSMACVVPALILIDALRSTVVRGTTETSAILAIVTVPFLFVSMFASALLLGRQAIRTSNLLSLGQSIASVVLLVLLVAAAGWGVDGAVAAYLLVGIGGSVASGVAVFRLAMFRHPSTELLWPTVRYGLKIYPGSLASFFSYRADVFLLSLLLGSPREVGLYTLAVSLAELLFYVADSVATAFFPRISAAEKTEADRLVPEVNRTTLLVTGCAAIGLVPLVTVGIGWALPAFHESIAVFFVLLPGIVSLSVSKVLSGYVSGLGHPARVGIVAVSSLAVNLTANLLLIPTMGIVGAAVSSALSYTFNASLMVLLTTRMAKVTVVDLLVPRVADMRRLARLLWSLAARRTSWSD